MHSKSDELVGNSDPLVVMSERMKKKFSKHWEDKEDLNNLLFIALILDPHYKVKFISFFLLGDLWSKTKTVDLIGKIESHFFPFI